MKFMYFSDCLGVADNFNAHHSEASTASESDTTEGEEEVVKVVQCLTVQTGYYGL